MKKMRTKEEKNKNKKLIAVSQLMPVAMNAEKDPFDGVERSFVSREISTTYVQTPEYAVAERRRKT